MFRKAIVAMVGLGLAVEAGAETAARTRVATAMPAGPVLLEAREIAALRAKRASLPPLMGRCDRDLGYAPQPIAVLALDPHYTATGVNTSPNNGKQLADDARTAYREGLCYLVSNDVRYAQAAQRILDAWAGTLTQVTTDQSKADINFNLTYMIAAATWTRGAGGWNSTRFDRFLTTTILPNSSSSNPNNHGAWGVLMEASAAAYLGDRALLTRARDRWLSLMQGAIASDGTLTREVERSGTTNWRGGPDKGKKGLAYSHYFLLPASLGAKVFADQGEPVWTTPSGRLFGKAFEKVAGWTLHPETFPYYGSNHGQLEGVRAASYFNLLLNYYPSADAEAVLRQGDVGDGAFILADLYGQSAR